MVSVATLVWSMEEGQCEIGVVRCEGGDVPGLYCRGEGMGLWFLPHYPPTSFSGPVGTVGTYKGDRGQSLCGYGPFSFSR